MRSIPLFLFCFCACAVFGEEEKAVNDPQFHKALLEIGACYERFGRVDDAMRWAPGLCLPPAPSFPRQSAAKGGVAHAGKLYFIFANQGERYAAETESDVWNDREIGRVVSEFVNKEVPAPELKKIEDEWLKKLGHSEKKVSEEVQKRYVLVKESWIPKAWRGDKVTVISKPAALTEADIHRIKEGETFRTRADIQSRDRMLPFLEKDDEYYTLGERGPLFIMYRTEKNTLGTDNGWVYGTLTPDGKTVTSAGRVASCMGCHTEAPYPKEPKGEGRLFGLPEKVKKKEN